LRAAHAFSPEKQGGKAGATSQTPRRIVSARVLQINRKPLTPGEPGLPKVATPRVHVNAQGLDGDFNVYRHEKKHDTPDRALLLYSVDKLAALNGEGWPLRPGDIGENLTLEGVAYEALQPGTEWSVGAQLTIRITEACHPCKTLAHLPYVGDARKREFIETMKGRRGWYAKVLHEGVVQVGDAFRPRPAHP
jgi:MOSC domain-containing protein YiiM